MSKPNHTPTPWRLYPAGTSVPHYDVCPRIVADRPSGRGVDDPISDADAEFIVLAVNAHEVLVEALHALAMGHHEGEDWHEESCPEDDTCDCALPSKYRAALKAAGAGT
jgi:hypothetical protein